MYQKIERALQRLEEMLKKGIDPDRAYVDSSIQRFEIAFELMWKTLKAFLEYQGIEANYPRHVFQEAYKGKLIDQESIWLQMMKDRNETSHIHDETKADFIYQNIKDYAPLLRSTLSNLQDLRKNE